MGNRRRKGQSKQRLAAACLSECAGLAEEPRCRGGVLDLGKQGARLLIVPVDDVAEVVPDERCVTLCLPFRLTSSERLSARAGPAAIPAFEPAGGGAPSTRLYEPPLPRSGAVLYSATHWGAKESTPRPRHFVCRAEARRAKHGHQDAEALAASG